MNMQKAEEPIVTVDGLKFKQYQMDCIKVLAEAEEYTDVKEWMQDSLVKLIVAHLSVIEHNYTIPLLEKLKEDGFE